MRNKERHGCLTAWLIYLIISSAIISYVCFFKTIVLFQNLPEEYSENVSLIVGSVGILNIFFCYLLFKWIKLGFWGLIATNFIMIIIQLMNGSDLIRPTLGVSCIIMLYFILQRKKNNISGWDNLE